MKIKYIKEPKPNDFYNELFTKDKEYEVIADYRLRQSGQRFRDDGLVIKDNKEQIQMVFLDSFKITDVEQNNTFVFKRCN